MKRAILMVILLFVSAINPVAMAEWTYFDDGASRTIADGTYQDDYIVLDKNTTNNPGTHINMADGGSAFFLIPYNNATVTMTGGLVKGANQGSIIAYDTAAVNMSGGMVGGLQAHDNATITMSGGSVYWDIYAGDNSTVNMSGGSVEREVRVYDNSVFTMTNGSVSEVYANSLRYGGPERVSISGGNVGDLKVGLLVAGSEHLAFSGNMPNLASYGVNTSGGDIGTVSLEEITTRDTGSVSMSDGFISNLRTYNNSTITMSGGIVSDLRTMDNSAVAISGGSVQQGINMYDDSSISISDSGWIRDGIYAYENATVTLADGIFDGVLYANGNASINVYGGSLGDTLTAQGNGNIYLNGTDFAITDLDGNTTSLSYGDKLSDFGTLVEWRDFMMPEMIMDYYAGTITGTLANGSALDTTFEIQNIGVFAGTGDIVIVPEPASFLLFGALPFLWRRKP